jgi:hypothetical protein
MMEAQPDKATPSAAMAANADDFMMFPLSPVGAATIIGAAIQGNYSLLRGESGQSTQYAELLIGWAENRATNPGRRSRRGR